VKPTMVTTVPNALHTLTLPRTPLVGRARARRDP
jgi:hypothetical protein